MKYSKETVVKLEDERSREEVFKQMAKELIDELPEKDFLKLFDTGIEDYFNPNDINTALSSKFKLRLKK